MAAAASASRLARITTLRSRYWWFMHQQPPRVKAARLCEIELRRLMTEQLRCENRGERRRA